MRLLKLGMIMNHDPNRNRIKDLNKGIVAANNKAGIQYNHLNLPTSATILNNEGGGNGPIPIYFRHRKIKLTKSLTGKATQYVGNYAYETEDSRVEKTDLL